MEPLSNVKIENILSLTGNNKCFECESSDVDWVSFPASVFICLNCGRRHKEFKFKPVLKSLSVSEFTPHEIKKMNLGGNARFHTLMDEYKISLKEPNIEYKYRTIISLYYFKLLEIQVNKIENREGAEQEYNKILGERPTYEIGKQIYQGVDINEINNIQEINSGENNKDNNNKTDSSLGGWLGYFGDKINNMTEYFGINSAIQNASNAMENFNIQETLNSAIDYTKNAKEYIMDKANKISQSDFVVETKEKVTNIVNDLKDGTMNIIKNTTDNIINPINNNNNQSQRQHQ